MRSIHAPILSGLLLLTAAGLVACQTSQPGVKSNYRSQWTTVNGNTVKATKAAKEVLEDLKLQSIDSRSTTVDGYAHGYTADNTKVTVDIKRVTDATSEVSVNVGSGDPALGTDIVARIQRELS